MISIKRATAWCVVLVMTLLAAPLATAGEHPAKWVPEDSIVYFGIPDVDVMVVAAKKTSGFQALNDPALEKMMPWKKVLDRAVKLIAKRLNLKNPNDLKVYPHGGVAFYMQLVAGEGNEPEPRVALIMDMGKDADRMKSLVDQIVRAAIEEGGTKETHEVAGSEVVVLHLPKLDKDATESLQRDIAGLFKDTPFEDAMMMGMAQAQAQADAPLESEIPEIVFARSGKRFIWGGDLDTVRDSLRRLKRGSEGSLASSSAMTLLKRKGLRGAHFEMIFNIPEIVSMASKEDKDAAKVMDALGLRAFGPFVLTQSLAPSEGIESIAKGFCELKDQRSGLAKLFAMPNTKTAPPAGLADDTALFASININVGTILSEVLAIAERMDPADAAEMRAQMTIPTPDGSTIDVQNDIANHLVGPLFGGLVLSKPYENQNVGAIVALGHNSRPAIEKLLSLIPPGFVMRTDMMGAAVLESPMAGMMAPGIASAVTDRALVFLGLKHTIEDYIRSEGRSDSGLAQSEAFKRIARHVPKKCCAIMFADGLKAHEAAVAIVKSGTVTVEPPPIPGSPAAAFLRWMVAMGMLQADVDDPAALGKYATNTIATMSTESDGLRFDIVATKARAK